MTQTQHDTTNTPTRNRLGRVKAAVWTNDTDKGAYLTANFFRTYKTADGNYRDTQGFSTDDVLRLAKLANEVHSQMVALEADLRAMDGETA